MSNLFTLFNLFGKKHDSQSINSVIAPTILGLQRISIDEPLTSIDERIEEAGRNLIKIIDTVDEPKTWVRKISRFWAKLPYWEKVLGSASLIGSCMVFGILFSISGLFMLGVCFAAVITVGGLLADDEYQERQVINKTLKERGMSLVGMLGSIISSLDHVRHGLADSVKRFSDRVTELEKEAVEFKAQMVRLSGLQDQLSITIERHEALNKKYQTEIDTLKEKMASLEAINTTMSAHNKQIEAVAEVLQRTVITLSEFAITDAKGRQTFQERLENFLGDSQASFDRILDRISIAEDKLVKSQDELAACNQRYREQLDEQRQILDMQAEQISIFRGLLDSKKAELGLLVNWRPGMFKPGIDVSSNVPQEPVILDIPIQVM